MGGTLLKVVVVRGHEKDHTPGGSALLRSAAQAKAHYKYEKLRDAQTAKRAAYTDTSQHRRLSVLHLQV